jgi:hypothetical protein
MLLKVALTKGIVRFGTKGKLSPRYIGPYVISTHVGALAYISVAVAEVYCRSTPGVSCLARYDNGTSSSANIGVSSSLRVCVWFF